jgi:hypothetical protein
VRTVIVLDFTSSALNFSPTSIVLVTNIAKLRNLVDQRLLGEYRDANNRLAKKDLGRAIAQAVSRWFPTAADRVQARVWSCGICVGQSGAGAGSSFHQFLHNHHQLSSGAGTIGQ